MKKALKILLPIALLIGAVAVWALLYAFRPVVEHKPVEVRHPMVSVSLAESRDLSIPVYTRGSVTPGTEILLTSEVGGQVLYISENFANGGFFRKGETLVKIDPLEYEVNIKRAEASLAQAKQNKVQADAERQVRSQVRGGNRTEFARFEVQYRQAEASYEAAKAELEAAKMQKSRSTITAPFDGRVRVKNVDVGQFVRPGMQIANIYAVDIAEVRLPLSDRQLGLVDVPLRFGGQQDDRNTRVTLEGQYGGKKYTWQGKIVRAEGGLDERNRLLYVVAQVVDPYETDSAQPARPPLAAGFFVEAQIEGRHHKGVFVIPRKALRNGSQLWLVDQDNRLVKREVDILYKGRDSIYVGSGLRDGERVVLSQLDIAVEGMIVRPSLEEKLQPEEVDNNNLLGNTTDRQLGSEKNTSDLNKRQFSREELMKLAEDAKKKYESMDEKTKKEIVAGVKNTAEAINNISASVKSGLEERLNSEINSANVVKNDPDGASKEADNSSQDRQMSPLASEIAGDIEKEMIKAELPKTNAHSQALINKDLSSKGIAKGTSQSSSDAVFAITKVAAPQPLSESMQ